MYLMIFISIGKFVKICFYFRTTALTTCGMISIRLNCFKYALVYHKWYNYYVVLSMIVNYGNVWHLIIFNLNMLCLIFLNKKLFLKKNVSAKILKIETIDYCTALISKTNIDLTFQHLISNK